jgi:hypothetical protein
VFSAGFADRLDLLRFGRARSAEYLAGLFDPESSDRTSALIQPPIGLDASEGN